jgi:Type II secretion system (T2SS), protein M subtype b
MRKKSNRTLIITIPLMAVLLGFILYQYVYLKIQSDVASIKESQSIKTRTLEKYISLIAEKPDMEKKLASLKESRKADDVKMIEGQTLSLASAALQDMVKDIITRSGGTISSQRVGKPGDLGKFKVITISMDTILPDPRALRDILYGIETQTPYLTVKDLDARIRNYKDPRDLVVKLDVSAMTSSR